MANFARFIAFSRTKNKGGFHASKKKHRERRKNYFLFLNNNANGNFSVSSFFLFGLTKILEKNKGGGLDAWCQRQLYFAAV